MFLLARNIIFKKTSSVDTECHRVLELINHSDDYFLLLFLLMGDDVLLFKLLNLASQLYFPQRKQELYRGYLLHYLEQRWQCLVHQHLVTEEIQLMVAKKVGNP